jgi:hypothetical protein
MSSTHLDLPPLRPPRVEEVSDGVYAYVQPDGTWWADLGAFAGMSDPERIVGNLHRAFAELSGTPRGGAIDVGSALADMVTYNGGRPLSCRA